MAFSGAWRDRAMARSDVGVLSANEPARHMTPYEPSAHGVDDTAVTRMGVQTHYPLDYPPDTAIDQTEEYGAPPSETLPPNYDQEDYHDHGLNDAMWSDNNEVRDSVRPTTAHQRDRGTARSHQRRVPMLEASDERHTTPRGITSDIADMSSGQRLRSTWTAPENNPADTVQSTAGDPNEAESPRRGWQGAPRLGYRVTRWNERKMPHQGQHWKHHVRGVPVHIAKTAGETPVPSDATQYVSPFAALANIRMTNFLSPMLRREPRAWDESVVTDGTDQAMQESTSQYQSWGL